MKRNYIYPTTEVCACIRTSMLCASGDSTTTTTVNTEPINDVVID